MMPDWEADREESAALIADLKAQLTELREAVREFIDAANSGYAKEERDRLRQLIEGGE